MSGFMCSASLRVYAANSVLNALCLSTLATLATLATLVLGCAEMPLTDTGSVARPAEFAVQIRRTSFGIPHIEADDESGLGFGAGYAFAQDNLCLLAEEMVTVNGERSLYFGFDGTYEPSGNGAKVRNLSSDVYFTVINHPSRVAASWESQPVDIQQLVLGYTRGVNRFLRDAAGALPEACRGQPWVREITHEDIVRLMRRFAVEGSGERMIEAIFAAQPPITPPDMPDPIPLPVDDLDPAAMWEDLHTPLGSNGIALGRDVTASGAGLLLAMPHFPWNGVLRFYQLHLVIPGKVDAMGATPAGLPVVGIGHNADLAWTHTVNSSFHFTFHQLALDPRNPTRYIVDGVSRPMTATDVEVKKRLPDGTVGTIRHRVWSTELGPIIAMPNLAWTAQTAFAFGDANADNTRFLQTWWAIDQAHSLTALRAAVEDTLGVPWVHTIAVDAGGTAYYGDVTPVPNLPDDSRCIPPGFAGLATTGMVVLDGSNSHCGWQIAPGTPIAGVVPASRLPTLVRTDFVQNSNDSAWMTNPAAPLTGFPAIVSRDRVAQNGRTRNALTYIMGEIAAGRRFTPSGLLDFAFSSRAFLAASVRDDLRAVCAAFPGSDVATPCTLLDRWDGTANVESVGWPMYRAWRTALDSIAAAKKINTVTVPFDLADPIGTPRGLRIADPVVADAARGALVQAMSALTAAGLDPRLPWGLLQRSSRSGQLIPIPGGGGDLSGGISADGGNEIYNKINSRPVDGRLEPFFGTSIVMAISFEGGVPSARGLLTYSQSSDPASPHFGDQTERYSRKDWISLPYTEETIESDPNLSVLELTE